MVNNINISQYNNQNFVYIDENNLIKHEIDSSKENKGQLEICANIFKQVSKIEDSKQNLTSKVKDIRQLINFLSQNKNKIEKINTLFTENHALSGVNNNKQEAIPESKIEGVYQHLKQELSSLFADEMIEIKSHKEWMINFALMMDIYNNTDDIELKNNLKFIVVNYLARSAKFRVEGDNKEMQKEFQIGISQDNYSRVESNFDKLIEDKIRKTQKINSQNFISAANKEKLLQTSGCKQLECTSAEDLATYINESSKEKELILVNLSKLLKSPSPYDVGEEIWKMMTKVQKAHQHEILFYVDRTIQGEEFSQFFGQENIFEKFDEIGLNNINKLTELEKDLIETNLQSDSIKSYFHVIKNKDNLVSCLASSFEMHSIDKDKPVESFAKIIEQSIINKKEDALIDISDYVSAEESIEKINIKIDEFVDQVYQKFIEDANKSSNEMIKKYSSRPPKILKTFIRSRFFFTTEFHQLQVAGFGRDLSSAMITKLGIINRAGVRLGPVEMRKAMAEILTLDEIFDVNSKTVLNVKYSPYSAQQGKLFFEDVSQVTRGNLFLSRMAPEKLSNEAETLLWKSTTDLITGLFGKWTQTFEIDDKTKRLIEKREYKEGLVNKEHWDSMKNSGYAPVVDTLLYRLTEHLSMARLHRNDFGQFSQYMELAQGEVAALLSIFHPFTYQDFQTSFKEQIKQNMPEELKDCALNAGLAHSAMNLLYSSIAEVKALKKAAGDDAPFYMQKSEGLYYETGALEAKPGDNQALDFYAGQIFKNIQLHTLDAYSPELENIQNDLRKALEGNKGKPLTVAMDTTMDFQNSWAIKDLLKTFASEIKDGKMCFMVYRSGQKFDMLGSDAYYGSPFYVLNNGDAKWNTISQMTQQEKYLADSLSTQWFASISQFAPSSVDQYRKLIFDNSKQISDGVKQKLSKETTEGVIPISQDNLAAFIDVRVHNNEEFISAMMKHLEKHKVKAHSKESFGFVYCNIDPITGGVVRVTPGINSEENQVIINFLNEWFASRKLTEPATPSS